MPSRILPLIAPRLHSEHMRFFRSWLSDPLTVGAVAPSGRSLARLITSEISPATGPALELGPGTGAFTRALLERGVAPHDLTLVEYSPDFAKLLEKRYPAARVLCTDAARLPQPFDGALFGAVVSGLPILSMPLRKVMMILTGAFRFLRPDGAFFQFTYGPRCPVLRCVLDRLGLKARCLGWTVRNVPPAAVYRISRR